LVTRELLRDDLPPGVELRRLGKYKLKDLNDPEQVFQLVSPDLPSDFPPLRALAIGPNLPIQSTPFIGREKEVSFVSELLGRENVRLVTLTGPGGVGKTRLALQVATNMVDEFEDGVFFVSL